MRKFLLLIAILLLLQLSLPGMSAAEAVVIIDPGHGGYNTGLRSPAGREKDLTLSLSKKIQEILRTQGYKVGLTRKIDQHLSIKERVALAYRNSPNIFISIHQSDSDGFAVYTTWYEQKVSDISLKQYYAIESRQRRYIYESSMFAAIMEDTLKEGFRKRVSHREMPLPLLSAIRAPALLIEVPLSGINYEEDMLRVASNIVLGILRYAQGR